MSQRMSQLAIDHLQWLYRKLIDQVLKNIADLTEWHSDDFLKKIESVIEEETNKII